MGKALYRKYRSKKLSEIVGQEHITNTLRNALKKGAISHAYLFTGPRGVGKTSIARILAHEINNLPYDDNSTHLDIIEIDAASNRRIDEIRELREKVHNAPTIAKYKVYIIDEVHMLTKEAFNALLKTLEEPPAHVVFILATTEAHKLPETIVSRTQRFTFKPIDVPEAVEHLRSIAKAEKFDITDQALALIAEHGRGSFRDSISLLDQISSGGAKVTADDVAKVLGIAPVDAINQLSEVLTKGSPAEVMNLLSELREQGFHAAQLAKQLAEILRQQLLNSELALPYEMYTPTLEKLIAVPASHDPNTALELVILSVVLQNGSAKAETPKEESPKSEEPQSKPKKEIPKIETKTSPTTVKISNEEVWPATLAAIKNKHNTLYSIARMAVPILDGDRLTLSFSFPFHQKRLNEARNKAIIETILLEQTGREITIDCIIDKNQKPTAAQKPEIKNNKPEDKLGSISNIFGSIEMLE